MEIDVTGPWADLYFLFEKVVGDGGGVISTGLVLVLRSLDPL